MKKRKNKTKYFIIAYFLLKFLHQAKELLTKSKILDIVYKMRGIIKVFNLKNDKLYLIESNDVEKDIISIRFNLDLALFPCKELQEEYANLGLELFTIDLEKEANDEDDLNILLNDIQNEYLNKGAVFYH